MDRILQADHRWALHGTSRSRQIEASALAEVAATATPGLLMQRAGRAVARLALAVAPHANAIHVEAGPGHNGGDGLEAACQLRRWGRSVEVTLNADPARLPPDAALAFARAREAGVLIHIGAAGWSASTPPDLLIDALLGLGANRPPQGRVLEAMQRLKGAGRPVLSVDLPSGLDGDTGQVLGEAAVRAAHTLSLLTLKPGLFTGAGRDHAGDVWMDTLQVAPTEPADAWLHAPTAWPPMARQHAQHKGSFGDVIAVGGANGMLGAPMMAARAAQAAGAGRVWLAVLSEGGQGVDPLRPELMWRHGLDGFSDDALRQATVVCGCGGGKDVAATLPRVLAHSARLVLDADGLNAVAASPALQDALTRRQAQGMATVLTPHPLEAARLLGCRTDEVQANRLDAATRLADRHGCVVTLKGSGTVTAAPGHPPAINPTGDASLATGGTGDVLAGFMGGLWSSVAAWATPLPPTAVALSIACDAVWAHGRAAQAMRQMPVKPSDLIDRLHDLVSTSTALRGLR